MSYILDSLKKSEEEREKGQSSTLQKLKAPAYMDYPAPNTPVIIILTAILVLVSMLVALYFFSMVNRNPANSGVAAVPPTVIVQTPTLAGTQAIQAEEPEEPEESSVEEFRVQRAPDAAVASLYQRIGPLEADGGNPRSIETVDAPGFFSQEAGAAEAATPEAEPVIPEESEAGLVDAPASSVSDVSSGSETGVVLGNNTGDSGDIPSLFALDVLEQRRIPSINYGAHIYASDNRSGFVILNGARMRVGQSLDNGIFVEKINDGDVVLSYNGLLFSLPAMKSWNNQ